jgi:hypothetical protein
MLGKALPLARVTTAIALSMFLSASELASAGPITLDTFHQFSFTTAGTAATGCAPADPGGDFCVPSSGTPTSFLDAPPWTFSVGAAGAVLTVLDAFTSGDRFEIFNAGLFLGLTSEPLDGDCGDDPLVCLADPAMSIGSFALGFGDYSLTIVPTASPDDLGSGYFRVSTAVLLPEPAITSLLLTVPGIFGLLGFGRRKFSSFDRPS